MALKTIVFASGNAGKFEEVAVLLNGAGYELKMQSEFGVESVEETGLSFVENALIKARNAAEYTDHPVLADDSGLEIDMLRGEPGIYSARYSGDHDFSANITKVLQNMSGVEMSLRTARFCCVMVLLKHSKDAMPMIFQGVWDGYIMEEMKGAGGFGYDPIFWDEQYQKSAAELPFAIKNTISHRAKAMHDLLLHLKNH